VTAPPWLGQYLIAVEKLEYLATRHALARPARFPTHGWELAPSMCGKPVYPLTVYAGCVLEFWPDEGVCAACVTAINQSEFDKRQAARADTGGEAGEED
jgi:hypothetical protein